MQNAKSGGTIKPNRWWWNHLVACRNILLNIFSRTIGRDLTGRIWGDIHRFGGMISFIKTTNHETMRKRKSTRTPFLSMEFLKRDRGTINQRTTSILNCENAVPPIKLNWPDVTGRYFDKKKETYEVRIRNGLIDGDEILRQIANGRWKATTCMLKVIWIWNLSGTKKEKWKMNSTRLNQPKKKIK